ncbi:MAG TPA: NADH-quinone oxidoreductase subunit C [Acidimicrobiales bacterium]|nr:NADH-quinone oxidoreductase subunit C [Acidimicrobiales bacterium]
MTGAPVLPPGIEHPGGSRQSVELPADELLASATDLLRQGYRLALVAAVDASGPLRVTYLFTSGPPDRRLELTVAVDRRRPQVPSLAGISFPAGRFEREMHDLFGIVPIGHPFLRRLVLHQHWPEGWYPMRQDAGPVPVMVDDAGSYPFVEVQGSGVYEIPVGPVHAGLIEPGHFRFSVVGETILKMKARLWFVHKGIERLFEGQGSDEGVVLAERISGDSAVGHGLAYCMAVEEARGIEVDQGTCELRCLLLELERLYNHVADVGALCNDVGFGLAQARALTLRERLLRLNASVTGHRLLRGAITPGEVRVRALPRDAELREIAERFHELVELARGQSTVVDRFTGTAVLGAEDAAALGVLGVVARASGSTLDARVAHPTGAPLMTGFSPAGARTGDVLARFDVRVEEAEASLAMLSDRCTTSGAPRTSSHRAFNGRGRRTRTASAAGTGIVEGWRGSVVHRVEVDESGRLVRVKIVDPSFFNWPALSLALADTIVPDFPLVNKSFNLSYAGNDL